MNIREKINGAEFELLYDDLKKVLYPREELLDRIIEIAFAYGACAEQERIEEHVLDLLQAVPVTTFPEPPKGEHGRTVDACSARAIRYSLMGLVHWFDRQEE